jgi:signal transduction histidine kinase
MFLLTGVTLLGIADLPALTVGRAVHAQASAGRPGAGDNSRFITNLPEVLLYSGIALAVLAAASVALGWLVADRALRPLRAITATAGEISATDLARRLEVTGAYDEFSDLGKTLDGLLSRLEAAFDSQRQFIANASHELRTPLTAERTVLQVAVADPEASAETLRYACLQVLRLGEQQEHLIDALLTLASSHRGLRKRETVDLAAIAGSVIGARAEAAAERGLTLDAHLDQAVADGDPDLAESLIANLIDNAIRHNVAGGQIRVATAARADRASIEISNTGPVVPPGEVARLFEPFQQLDRQRARLSTGHGLGLAIVAAIAAAHNATVDASPGTEGGLDITVGFARGDSRGSLRPGKRINHSGDSVFSVTGSQNAMFTLKRSNGASSIRISPEATAAPIPAMTSFASPSYS